jgi:hypothetical protein
MLTDDTSDILASESPASAPLTPRYTPSVVRQFRTEGAGFANPAKRLVAAGVSGGVTTPDFERFPAERLNRHWVR